MIQRYLVGARGMFTSLCSAALVVCAGARADTFPGSNGPIAFSAGHRDASAAGAADLYLLKSGGSIQRLSFTYGDTEYSPSFSPDGRSIAFVKQNLSSGKADIWVIQSDGSGLRQVTFDGVFKDGPTFSPDGKRIAYSAATLLPFTMHIFSIGVDSSFPWDHTPLALGVAEQPSFNPADGNMLAYAWSPNGVTRNIVLLNVLLGLTTTLVSETNASNTNPNFSPNGKTVIYERHAAADDSIRTIAVSGGTPTTLLSAGPNSLYEPAYSPDGYYVVFSTGYHLDTLQLGTLVRSTLTSSTDDRVPSWGVVPH